MKITVVGIGYVGLANAILLAQNHSVTLIDIVSNKVDLINQRKSPFQDTYISEYLESIKLDLNATMDQNMAYKDAELIILATPTDYDPATNFFNTKSIEESIETILKVNSKVPILVKSTVPVGYTKSLRLKFKISHISFSPEFLREGQALYDCLYPSRIIISNKENDGNKLAELFVQGAIKKDIPILYTDSNEAEAIKLFSNMYLAMRVTFFNELDTFASKQKLSTKQIIDGVSLDPRIGDYYNNPSFGYGGYCLPKDTKQLLANYKDIPNNIMQAIVDSNETRKEFLVEEIINTKAKVIGIYRLIMKSNSDNYRESAILGIIERLKEKKVEILVYEPQINQNKLEGLVIVPELHEFMSRSEIIVANRYHPELEKVKNKVYSRDINNRD
ncbi:nucleotide sugar dehydrogenase [Methylophilaceae bacterium]|nr:nucleotide sugar dehydrogenase [Methylophilaceae bacterium]